jgi:hypothetical protein
VLEMLEGIQSGSALVNKNLLNIGEVSKEVNVIVKGLVLLKDTVKLYGRISYSCR